MFIQYITQYYGTTTTRFIPAQSFQIEFVDKALDQDDVLIDVLRIYIDNEIIEEFVLPRDEKDYQQAAIIVGKILDRFESDLTTAKRIVVVDTTNIPRFELPELPQVDNKVPRPS